MKFLCAKVKELWLTSSLNKEKVLSTGLDIKGAYIGIEIKNEKPNENELNFIHNAIQKLFEENQKAFPVRLIEV